MPSEYQYQLFGAQDELAQVISVICAAPMALEFYAASGTFPAADSNLIEWVPIAFNGSMYYYLIGSNMTGPENAAAAALAVFVKYTMQHLKIPQAMGNYHMFNCNGSPKNTSVYLNANGEAVQLLKNTDQPVPMGSLCYGIYESKTGNDAEVSIHNIDLYRDDDVGYITKTSHPFETLQNHEHLSDLKHSLNLIGFMQEVQNGEQVLAPFNPHEVGSTLAHTIKCRELDICPPQGLPPPLEDRLKTEGTVILERMHNNESLASRLQQLLSMGVAAVALAQDKCPSSFAMYNTFFMHAKTYPKSTFAALMMQFVAGSGFAQYIAATSVAISTLMKTTENTVTVAIMVEIVATGLATMCIWHTGNPPPKYIKAYDLVNTDDWTWGLNPDYKPPVATWCLLLGATIIARMEQFPNLERPFYKWTPKKLDKLIFTSTAMLVIATGLHQTIPTQADVVDKLKTMIGLGFASSKDLARATGRSVLSNTVVGTPVVKLFESYPGKFEFVELLLYASLANYFRVPDLAFMSLQFIVFIMTWAMLYVKK